MSPNAHERRIPDIHGREQKELSPGKLVLRMLGAGVALLVAVLALNSVFFQLTNAQSGWQVIQASNPETGVAEDFMLSYQIGAGKQSASAELKGVSAVYSEVLDHAYRVLSNAEFGQYTNLYTLNSHPNETLTVDPLTYAAFETVAEAGSRLPYFAPLFSQYESLFACSDDSSAENFDPLLSDELAVYAQEIAAFANDESAVQVVLLPDQQLRLEVSDAYLAYAVENELESFVDFGFLMNAFLCDAAADALQERGYTNGYLTSEDGYVRVLCTDELALPLYVYDGGKIVQTAEAKYTGPAALTICRSFPTRAADESRYYRYSDGSIRAPYMGSDGLLHCACDSLITLSDGSTAALALRTAEAFAQPELPAELEGISWIAQSGSSLTSGGDRLQIS